MQINRYKPNGYMDSTRNITPAAADILFNRDKNMAAIPGERYYRITVVDSSGRIVRDTDHELFGRQTIAPGTLMFHGVDPIKPRDNGFTFNPNHDLLNWDGVE